MKKTISHIVKKTRENLLLNEVRHLIWPLALSLVFIIIAVELIGSTGVKIEDVQRVVRDAGPWGIMLLILFETLSVMSPLPDTPASLTSVAVYGPFEGGLIIYSGCLLGAMLDFLIIRLLGRQFVEKHFPSIDKYINILAKEFGFHAMVFFRIFPTVTFDIASYAAALTRVKFSSFIIATSIGLLAPVTVYGIIGTGLVSGNIWVAITTAIVGLSLFGVVYIVTRIWFKDINVEALEK